MAKKSNYYSVIIIFFVAILLGLNVYAAKSKSRQVIKVAILDNFISEKSSDKYKNAYFAGVSTAQTEAFEKGFILQIKTFTYGRQPLGILDCFNEVYAWKPDLIIGPHSSNQLLLMQKYFKDVLVISPYATDEATTKLPINYYSLSWPDSYIAKATISFINKYYQGRDIFNIIQADCKDCYDVTAVFNQMYKSKYPKVTITNSYYLGSYIENLNMKNLMEGYKPRSIIILQPLNYADANLLILKISDFLKEKNLIFIHNLDNWGNSSEARKTQNKKGSDYSSFRVCPLIDISSAQNYSTYVKFYRMKYHSVPSYLVSYMTYASIMSAIDPLTLDPAYSYKTHDIKQAILYSHLAILKKFPNWYRTNAFVYYQLGEGGENKKEIIFNARKM